MSKVTIRESDRYDRQVRVWGAEVQARLQKARVLICGSRGIAAEVAKNLVLAGVSVTIQDDGVVTPADLECNFFITEQNLGQSIVDLTVSGVQELNTSVVVEAIKTPLDQLTDEFFAPYNVFLLCDSTETQARRLNSLARKRPTEAAVFFWALSMGVDGAVFVDFGESFTYKPDTPPPNPNGDPVTPQPPQTLQFPTLESMLATPWNAFVNRQYPLSSTFVAARVSSLFRELHGRHLTSGDEATAEALIKDLVEKNGVAENPIIATMLEPAFLSRLCGLSGVGMVLGCSILGAFLAQEVMKGISHTGAPARNVLIFSSDALHLKSIPINSQ